MKKLLAALAVCLTLASCGGDPTAAPVEAVAPVPPVASPADEDLAAPPPIDDQDSIPDPAQVHTFRNAILPRLQWDANFGYCGETSFISAGLHFGQYCSQFTARSLASPGVDQALEKSQLLLGINEVETARKLGLKGSAFDTTGETSTHDFMAWIKRNTVAGRIVIIGVYNNVVRLDEKTTPDPIYDHIVPVLGIASQHSLQDGAYFPTDIVTFSDNGLFGPGPDGYHFFFSYHFGPFQGTRAQADRPDGPLYKERETPPNYGYAVEGVLDDDGVTIPVSLAASLDHEPRMENGNKAPVAEPLTLTASVTLPDPNQAYNLYLYTDFCQVPTAGFNSSPYVQTWSIPAGTPSPFVVSLDVMTDSTIIFRAVPTTAP